MKKRKLPQIGAGSMADIAFLLLVFFLVSTTMQTDAGLSVLLPVWQEDPKESEPKKDSNVLSIIVNSKDELMVEKKEAKVSELKNRTMQLILQEAESPKKAIVSIQNDQGTSYNMYIAVYNEVKAGYHEIWDNAAIEKYGQHYKDLKKASQKSIREVYPLVISEVEPSNIAIN